MFKIFVEMGYVTQEFHFKGIRGSLGLLVFIPVAGGPGLQFCLPCNMDRLK